MMCFPRNAGFMICLIKWRGRGVIVKVTKVAVTCWWSWWMRGHSSGPPPNSPPLYLAFLEKEKIGALSIIILNLDLN